MPTIETSNTGTYALLKERYPKMMDNTITEYTAVLDIFQEGVGDVFDGPDGRYWKLANLYGGLQGIGSRLEGEFLPEGGTQLTINPLVKLKYHYGRVDFTAQTFLKLQAGPAAFADFGTSVLLPTVENLTDDLDRQACGWASGILARIDGTPAAQMPVDAPFGLASDIKGWINFKAGMRVMFSPNVDGSAPRSGGLTYSVTSVNVDGNSGGGILVLNDFPADALDNDYIFRADSYGSNAPSSTGEEREMMGIEGLIDDGTVVETLQNVSRTTINEWKSRVINGASAPYSGAFTEGLMLKAITDAGTIGGGKPRFVLCSHDVGRQAYNAIRGLGGFGSNRDPAQVKAGYKGVTIDTPMGTYEIRSVPRIASGRAYVVDTTTLIRVTMGTGDWVDTFGNSIFHQQAVGGAVRDAGFAYYRKSLNLATSNPKKSLKIIGLSEVAF